MSRKNFTEHETLSKSRFKFLIDQIERKLNQPHQPADQDQTYISSSSTFNYFKRNRMLPKYLNNSRPQSINSINQKQISVNLEFNKLLLHQKKKFIEHSPNDKDLLLNLPQIKIQSKKNLKTHKKRNPFDRTSPRWKLKPLIIEKILLVTEPTDNLFKSSNKWANLDFYEDKKNQTIHNDSKIQVKNQQNRKFKQMKSQNEPYEKIQGFGRFSHNEKRRGLKMTKQKLVILTEKQNVRLEMKPQTTNVILNRTKLKVLNLDKLKMSQTHLKCQ